MGDYVVKLRVPLNIEKCEYNFIYSTFGGESEDIETFKSDLLEFAWKVGFNKSDWERGDHVWIFKLMQEMQL